MHWLLEKLLIFISAGTGIGFLGYAGYTVIAPRNLEDTLRLEGFKMVVSEEDWKKIAAKHNDAGADDAKMPGLTAGLDESKKIEEVKNKCKELMKTLIGASDFETNKTTAKTWCTDRSKHLEEGSDPPAKDTA